jgi:hypothetical protein
MKVICARTLLSEEQIATYNTSWREEGGDHRRALTVGKEYLVYGLTFNYENTRSESGVYVLIVPDHGYLMLFRLAYFRISDSHVSSSWHVGQTHSGEVALYPAPFFDDNFLESYSTLDERSPEEIPELRRRFEQITTQLLTEPGAV